ncbi:hypothetical protein [Candidatus Phycorickettsia trachydisci]|nr:hypothetical protein [Candidatus Phycorickettsia trachydisci]
MFKRMCTIPQEVFNERILPITTPLGDRSLKLSHYTCYAEIIYSMERLP